MALDVDSGASARVPIPTIICALTIVALLSAMLSTPPARADDGLSLIPDTAALPRSGTVDLDVLGNDSGPDGAALQDPELVVATPPDSGVAEVVDPDGPGGELPHIRFTADPSGPAAIVLTYGVTEAGQTGQAEVRLTVAPRTPSADEVTPAASAPMALQPDSVTAVPGALTTIPVLANDDPGGSGPLTVVSVTQPSRGGLIALTSGEGQVQYRSSPGFSGSETFLYTARDAAGYEADAQVTVQVAAAPRAALTVRIPSLLTVRLDSSITVRATGFNANGREAQLQRRSGSSWVNVAKARMQATGGTIRFVPTTSLAGLKPGRNQAEATLRVRTTTPEGAEVLSAATKARVQAIIAITVSGALTRAAVPYSYRPGCPVPPSSLRRIRMNHWDYSGALVRGTLIVRAESVSALRYVFERAFARGFQMKSVIPTDAFYKGGARSPVDSDRAAMQAGNTSAFNCRPVVGNPTKRSAHSYGIAIDINTFENPYVVRGGYFPSGSGSYLTRSPCRKGMVCPGGSVATAMQARGWPWGARWYFPDYQHFSSNGS